MKFTKKTFLLLSALLLAGTAVTSCGDAANDPGEAVGTGRTDTQTVSEAETDGLDFTYPTFDGMDYNGDSFTIYRYDWGMLREYFEAEEQNGDILNDTLWAREQKVMDLLNIDIQYDNPDGVDFNLVSRVRTQVMAGDQTYDLFLTHCCMENSTMAAAGYLYNFHDLPNIDLSQPYWNQNMLETIDINGFLPVAFGDYMIPDPDVIFFNKKMLADYDLPSPYDMVKNGTWTWDALMQLSSSAAKDLNGDGKMDDSDQYGFIGELDWQFNGIMQSTDEYLISRASDGTYSFNPLSEKTVNMIQKLSSFIYDSGFAYTYLYKKEYDVNYGMEPPVSFKDGKALFFMVPMNTASAYRDTAVDFGILPFPKYDEQQKTYNSLNWSALMAVPSNAENPERTGAVLELLNAEGRASVLPVYYDIVLTSKISRDNESAEMLDIIFNNIVFDFGMTYNISGDMLYLYPNILKTQNTDVSSYYEKNIKTANKKLENFLEDIEEIASNS